MTNVIKRNYTKDFLLLLGRLKFNNFKYFGKFEHRKYVC